MQDVQDIAMNNYQENMEYFKQNHIILYSKLLALEQILDDGRYTQKYELEYKDGYFDVLELNSKLFLYNQDSKVLSDKLTSQINFTKDDQSFKSYYNISFTEKALVKMKDESALMMHATTAPIINYHDSCVSDSDELQRVHKFIFIGTGLGLHIPSTINKMGADSIWIIEEDIELFRLSMFTCNYKVSLAKRHVYFSIAQTKEEFSGQFIEFYLDIFIQNLFLKFQLFSDKYKHKIKEIQTLIATRPETIYSHEYLLYKNNKVLQKLTEEYNFLDISKKYKETFFADKPVIIIGAGPSLHKNISWLKEHQEEFVIISVFAALKTLNKNNIKPDIVVQIDEKVTQTALLMESFESFEFLKDAIFIFNASVADILFETFDKKSIFLLQDRTNYKLIKNSLTAFSVGEIAYAMAMIFNSSKTCLLGLDLAVSDDGTTHAKDHHLGKKLDTSKVDEIQKGLSIMDDVLYTKGNFKDKVMTTPVFSLSINKINQFTQIFKTQEQDIYNLNDGAFFNDCIPLHPSDYKQSDKLNKDMLKDNLLTLFANYSSNQLTDQEVLILKQKEKQVEEFYTLLNDFSQSASTNKSLFLKSFTALAGLIVNSQESEINEIMRIYLFKSSPYIIDMFNTTQLSNPKKHTKQIKKIIVTQIKKILDLYKENLLKAIEKV